MSSNIFSSVLWVSSLVLNCGLIAVLIGKGSLRRFPFFGAYATFTLFESALCYSVRALRGSEVSYFYVYWVCEGISVILGFAVVYEVFRKLLTPYPALRRIALLIFQLSVIVLLTLAACVVLFAQSAAERSKFAAAVMVVEEATRVMEVGLLMFLFLFSTAFGLHWRQCVFGMALGLGIFATVELVGITMRNYWGPAVIHSFSMMRAVAFSVSLLIWAGYLLAREKETILAESPHHGQLEQWNQVLTEFIYQ